MNSTLCRMKCTDCSHETDDLSHDKCRTHALCSRQGRYDYLPCHVCKELWQRARHSEDPSDTIVAVDLLEGWIEGFSRNSRQRKWLLSSMNGLFVICQITFIWCCFLWLCLPFPVLILSYFTGQAGVSHWIFPEQREEFRELKVLASNFKHIADQEKPSRVIFCALSIVSLFDRIWIIFCLNQFLSNFCYDIALILFAFYFSF